MPAATASADVRAVWRGRAPLWVTYWLWGVGGNMSLLLLLVALWAAGAGPALLWAVWGLGVGWHAFVWGAIWRSAAAYGGPPVWPRLARLGLFLGVARLAAEAALLAIFA